MKVENDITPKKKVLFFLQNGVGGAERMTINIAKMLNKNDFDIHFIIIGKDKKPIVSFIPDTYDVRWLYIKRMRQFATCKIIKLLNKEKPDIVFASVMYLNVRLIIASKLIGGIKIIIRNDNSLMLISGITKKLVKFTYNLADTIIAQQDEMADEIRALPKMMYSKVVTLYNPIDAKLIEEKLCEAESPYHGDSNVNIVNVANVSERKGQDVLLMAFNSFHKINKNSHLYFIGDANNTDYLKLLESYIELHGLEGYVHFLGFTNNPYVWMKYADCFVLSSRLEGLPNALIEASYLKVPLVSTMCVPVVSKIVNDGYNGYVVPVDDYEAMSDAMSKAIALKNFDMVYSSSSEEDYCKLFY